MKMSEVGDLLTLASGFDRFIQADGVTTTAWFLAIGHLDYADAERATVEHFTGPLAKETFGVRHVLNAVAVSGRQTVAAVEADVRSAKARRLVPKSWPDRQPLPQVVQDALFTLRAAERRAAEVRFEFDQLPGKPTEIGDIGRSVPA